MGVDYSYECVSVKVKKLFGTYGEQRVYLCDLKFVDEHEHRLADVQDCLVDDSGHLVQYPENIVPEDSLEFESQYLALEPYCKNYPGYDVYNSKELAEKLSLAEQVEYQIGCCRFK